MRSNRWEDLRRNRSKSQRKGHLERLHQAQLFELAEKQTKIFLADTDFKICELKKKQPTTAVKVADISSYLQRSQYALNYQLSSRDTGDNQAHNNSYRYLCLSRSRSRSHSFNSSSEDSDSSSFSSSNSLDFPTKKQKIHTHPVSHSYSYDSPKIITLTVYCEQNLSQNKFFPLLDRIETLITTEKQTIDKLSFNGSFNDNLSLLVPMKTLSLTANHSILVFNYQNMKTSFTSIVPYLQKQERHYVKQFKILENEKQLQRQQQIEIEEDQDLRTKKEQKKQKNELADDAEEDISSKSNALSLLQFETLIKLAFANKDLQFIKLSIPSHTSFLLSRALSKIHKKKLHLLSSFECISSGYLPSKELLDQLKKFPLLKRIKLLEIIPSDIASITSFNALLQKVDSFEFNFEEITYEAASLLNFKEQYEKIDISVKIDIITNPAILDVLLTALSKIKSVNQFKLTNTFYQREYCGTGPGSSFRDLKILIKQLELDLGLAKQIDYKQYLFFKRLSSIHVTEKLQIQTVANQTILESLCSLLTSPNIEEVVIQQSESNALHSQFLSPLLMKDLKAFYTCDYSCILAAWSKAKSKKLTFDSSYCRASKDKDSYSMNLNKNSVSIQLNSYRFKIKNIKNLIFEVKNLAQPMHLEQICRSIAKCKSLKSLYFKADFSQPLLKLIQRDTLQTENANQSYVYLSQLSALNELENVKLYLHVDQAILDSIAALIQNSNSLLDVTFKRSQLNQYNLDYSKLLKSLRQSQTVQTAEILSDFQTVYVSELFKQEWRDAMSTSFTVPLCRLLKSKKCKLESIKISTPISYKNECVPLHNALLLNRNQTQLKIKTMHIKQSKAVRHNDTEIITCINCKRLSFGI